ncbi:MAG: hypothetical protein ACE5Z5_00275 [Candidatus Bathyarchaeia archaeon]
MGLEHREILLQGLGHNVFYLTIGVGGGLLFLLVVLFRPAMLVFSFLLFPFLNALTISILYMLLAPAAIDDRGVGDSVNLGFETIRRELRVFLVYVALVFVVQLLTRSLMGVNVNPIMGSISPVINVVPIVEGLSSMTIISEIVNAIVSPLLFLLAFLTYATASRL